MKDVPQGFSPDVIASVVKKQTGKEKTVPVRDSEAPQTFHGLGVRREGGKGFATLSSVSTPTRRALGSPASPQADEERATVPDRKVDGEPPEATIPSLPPGHPPIKVQGLPDLRGDSEKRIKLRRSVLGERRVVPLPEIHILEPGASFATEEEMLEARAAGRRKAVADTKDPRNTLFAYAIEDIWKKTGDYRRSLLQRGSRSGIGSIRTDAQRKVTDTIPLSHSRADGYSADDLRLQMRHMLWSATDAWTQERNQETPFYIPDENLSDEGKNYRTLCELTGIINSSEADEKNFTPLSPRIMLRGGARTATTTIWRLYDLIEPLHVAQYEKAPTRDDFDQLFDSANDLAASVAVGNLTLAIGMLGHLTDHTQTPHGTDIGKPFKIDDFTITEDVIKPDDGPPIVRKRFAIKPEAFAAFEQAINLAVAILPKDHPGLRRIDEDATGCPAIFAKGTGPISAEATDAMLRVQHVVKEIGEWSKMVAQEHLDAYQRAR